MVLELNLKKLEKVAFENATHSQEFLMKTKLEKAAHSQKAPTLENAGFLWGGGGGLGVPSPTVFWQQLLYLFCHIPRSYMASGQCYEGNIFIIALPSTFTLRSSSGMASHAAQYKKHYLPLHSFNFIFSVRGRIIKNYICHSFEFYFICYTHSYTIDEASCPFSTQLLVL